MNADARAIADPPAACALAGRCPLCGEPNRCRLESGEAYKGPCWCERPTVSAGALRRLLADVVEPRCLCLACLQRIAAEPEIAIESFTRIPPVETNPLDLPITPGEGDFYWEGAAMVFTARFHLRRGTCCGSGCRHCPYRG